MDGLLRVRKPNHAFFIFLFFVSVYVGYCVGKLAGMDITLDNALSLCQWALFHPLPFQITALTAKSVLICIMVWMVAYAQHITSVRNYMPGREYGSGKLAKLKDVNKALADSDPRKNKIISEHIRISMDTRLTKLNNNMVVIGGSGAGKSFLLVKPNGYNCGYTSYVFTDPKG